MTAFPCPGITAEDLHDLRQRLPDLRAAAEAMARENGGILPPHIAEGLAMIEQAAEGAGPLILTMDDFERDRLPHRRTAQSGAKPHSLEDPPEAGLP